MHGALALSHRDTEIVVNRRERSSSSSETAEQSALHSSLLGNLEPAKLAREIVDGIRESTVVGDDQRFASCDRAHRRPVVVRKLVTHDAAEHALDICSLNV